MAALASTRFRVPHTLVLLFGMIVVAQLLTYMLPKGSYERVSNEHHREQVVPNSYAPVTDVPALPWYAVLSSIPRGFAAAQSIIFFCFIVGGAFGVMRATGAIDAFRGSRDDMPQWVEVTPGQTYIFVPDSARNRAAIANEPVTGDPPTGRVSHFASMDPTSDLSKADIKKKRIRTWPYGIRVTVRVFDPLGRLDAPIERSLIHRFD